MSVDVIVAGCIGFVGLILGVINLIWNIQLNSTRLKILTECTMTQSRISKIDYRAFDTEIVNISKIKTIITDTGIQFRKKRKCEYYKIDPLIGLPTTLEHLDSFGFMHDERFYISFLKQNKFTGKVRMRVYCKDITDKRHYGKRMKIKMNTSKWNDFNEELLPVQNRIDLIYG